MADRKDAIELWASAARTAGTGTSEWVDIPKDCMGMVFVLDVTAAATDAGDTLDVEVFTRIGTTTAREICHFTQVLGNGGALVHIDKILVNTAVATYTYAALAAGAKKDILGSQIQCKYTIVDADADGGFTFSAYALPL